jgi:hypothetical protein
VPVTVAVEELDDSPRLPAAPSMGRPRLPPAMLEHNLQHESDVHAQCKRERDDLLQKVRELRRRLGDITD